jgi:protein phosphatase 2C family protein 2/3
MPKPAAAKAAADASATPATKQRHFGVFPEAKPATKPCGCEQSYLQASFCRAGHPPMEFHDRFFHCEVCHARPVQHLCCKCWKGYCEKHAQEHYAADQGHHIFANYELWQYEECFSCLKCHGFAMCEAFDQVLEPLFMSKGSFTPVPVTDKHSEAFSGHGVSVGAATMQGWRSDNEDSHVVYIGLPHSKLDFYGVYDGHGGPLVSRFVGKRLHEMFDMLWKASHGNGQVTMAGMLTKTFMMMDEAIARDTTGEESGSTGSTSCVVVVNRPEKRFWCANSGDARAVLCRANRAVDLSFDHRPSLPSERKRILAAGSTIEDDRVDGLLAVCRAFGDFDFKQASNLPPQLQPVTCFPDVTEHVLTPEDKFIIIGCDGIWDCMSSQAVVSFVASELENHGDPTRAANALLDKCVVTEIPEDGSGTDNMSALVVLLPN